MPIVTSQQVTPEHFLGDWQPLEWLTDYAEAMAQADRQVKMLLIHFYDPANPKQSQRVEQRPGQQPGSSRAAGALRPGPPADRRHDPHPRKRDSSSWTTRPTAELQQGQGVIIIDYANPTSEHYSQVVSALPFRDRQILPLPRGAYAGVARPARRDVDAADPGVCRADSPRGPSQHQGGQKPAADRPKPSSTRCTRPISASKGTTTGTPVFSGLARSSPAD